MAPRSSLGVLLLLVGVGVGLMLWVTGWNRSSPVAPPEARPPASIPNASVPDAREPESPAVQPPATPPVAEAIPEAAPAPAVVPGKPIVAATLPPAPAAPAPVDEAIHTEIESVGTMIRDFRNAVGGNPVGTNAEITKALLGDNEKQVKFELPPGASVNGQGELVDRWGSPYFFHQVSGTQMDIRSAGPDRRLWTPDDVQGR